MEKFPIEFYIAISFAVLAWIYVLRELYVLWRDKERAQ